MQRNHYVFLVVLLLIGIAVARILQTYKVTAQAFDELLRNPSALSQARSAASFRSSALAGATCTGSSERRSELPNWECSILLRWLKRYGLPDASCMSRLRMA